MPVASVEQQQQLMNTTYLKIAFWESEVEAFCLTTSLPYSNIKMTINQLLSVWSFCRMHSSKICWKAKTFYTVRPHLLFPCKRRFRGWSLLCLVSCAGLDRIAIKGSKSREPILFAANRMRKCFSLALSPLRVLVKTAKWCCASSEDPKPSFHFMDVTANEKRTWKLWQRRVQEVEEV